MQWRYPVCWIPQSMKMGYIRDFQLIIAYTSQGCSICSYTDRTNRNHLNFTCRAFGYKLHSDLIASRNIHLRGILARQALCEYGLSSISPEALLYGEASCFF